MSSKKADVLLASTSLKHRLGYLKTHRPISIIGGPTEFYTEWNSTENSPGYS